MEHSSDKTKNNSNNSACFLALQPAFHPEIGAKNSISPRREDRYYNSSLWGGTYLMLWRRLR